MLRRLTDAAIDHPLITLLAAAFILLLGGYALTELPVERDPDIAIPVIVVTVPYPAASPSEVEQEILIPLESRLQGLDDLDYLRGSARQGAAVVACRFLEDADLLTAKHDIADRVELARAEFPAEARTPVVVDITLGDVPIMLVAVSAEAPARVATDDRDAGASDDGDGDGDARAAVDVDVVALRDVAKDLADAIEVVPGVASVELYGGRERRVEIVVDPVALGDEGFTMLDVERALTTQLFDVPGGNFRGDANTRAIHIDALAADPAELTSLQVTSPLGAAKPLGDLATITLGLTDVDSLSRVNGAPCVTLIVQRKASINVLATNEAVRAAVDAHRARVPEGVTITATQDIGKEIREMQGQLGSSAIYGALIVITLLFAAVGLRNALFVIIAIPLTVVTAALAFWATGESINNMTLFSLIVILGLVVDGATIVVENIHRQLELGRSPIQAAKLGIHEVAASVLVADITTIAAFLPILFLSGPTGEFMALLPITVTVTLIGSLLVDHFLLPTLMARLMPAHVGPRRSLLGVIARTTRLYRGTWSDVARPGTKSTLDAGRDAEQREELKVTLTPPKEDGESRRVRAVLPNTVRIGVSDTRSSRKDSTMRSRREDMYGETALRLRLPMPPIEVIDDDGAQLLADVLLNVARDPFTRVRLREATAAAMSSHDSTRERAVDALDDTKRRRADLRYDKGDRLSEHLLAARNSHRITRPRKKQPDGALANARMATPSPSELEGISTPEADASEAGSLDAAFAELDLHADTLRIESDGAQRPVTTPPAARRAEDDREGAVPKPGEVDPFAAFDRSHQSDSSRGRRAPRPTSDGQEGANGPPSSTGAPADKPSTDAAMAGALKQMVALSQTTWHDGAPPSPDQVQGEPASVLPKPPRASEPPAEGSAAGAAEHPTSSRLVALAADTRHGSSPDRASQDSEGADPEGAPTPTPPVAEESPGGLSRVRDAYEGVLRRLMRASPLVHLSILLAFSAALIAMFVFKIVGFEYMPNVDRSRFVIRVEHPVGTPIERTQETLTQLEAVLQQSIDERAEAGLPPLIEHYVSIAGETNALQADIRDRQAAGPEQGKIQVELVEVAARDLSQFEILALIERDLPDIDGATITVEQISEGPPAGADLAIRLTGDEYADLERASEAVVRLLRDARGTRDVESDYRPTRPELTVKVDRQRAADARVQPAAIARTVQLACNGEDVNALELEGEPVDIVLRAPGAVAASIDAIKALPVRADTGRLVPLGDVADVRRTTGANMLMRFDGRRAITVRCNLAEGALLSDVQAAFERDAARDETLGALVPEAVTLTYGGETEERDRSYRELTVALAVGLALVLFLLVAYFNSAARALVILAVVPLGLIGVLIGLLITGNTFNILSFVGIVALTGIVVNDAIVLVDFERQARRNGNGTRSDVVHESVVQAARLRLRPILLTTVTTIGGLLPLALQWGGTNDFWAPLCWAIIFGLAFATTMTLLVLPVLLNDVLRLSDATARRPGVLWRTARALIG